MAPLFTLPHYVNKPTQIKRASLEYRSPKDVYAGEGPTVAYDEVLEGPKGSAIKVPKGSEIEVPVKYWVPLSMLNRSIATWQLVLGEIEEALTEEGGEDESAAWEWARKLAISNVNYHLHCRDAVLKETVSIGADEMSEGTSIRTLNEWVYRQFHTAHTAEKKLECPDDVLGATAATLDTIMTTCNGKGKIAYRLIECAMSDYWILL